MPEHSRTPWLRTMRPLRGRGVLALVPLGILGLSLPALSQQTAALADASCRSMGRGAVEAICLSVLLGSMIALAIMQRRLRLEGWSLAQALSETVKLPAGAASGEPSQSVVRDASSSRLIAMAGMLVILLLYLGFGVFCLYSFGMTCTMPSQSDAATRFLYAGLTLFAPYIANKFSNVFQPLIGRSAPRPTAAAAATPVAPPEPTPAPQAATEAEARPAPVETPPANAPSAAPRTAAASGTNTTDPHPYAAGIALIASFEGCVTHAYPDPASGGEPWTIGYGFTSLDGRAVRPGDSISQSEADALLQSGVEACAQHLSGTIPYWAEMSDDQRCALISFAWNLGENFYGDTSNFATISRDLRERLWNQVPDDLLLYCNPGSAVEAGLKRRRQAEGDLWRRGLSTTPAQAAEPTPGQHSNPLTVPYFDQLKMNDGEGWRDCFSASSAMLAAFWGKTANEDAYNTLRERYGDSTSAEAQLAALRHLGLQAEFRTDGDLEALQREINAGRPVAVGWLHHGPPSAPSGGGHWTVVIGYDATGVIMNDPYGSCDLIHGGYPQNHDGASQHYSYRNWLPRWRPQNSGGWYLCCQLPAQQGPST